MGQTSRTARKEVFSRVIQFITALSTNQSDIDGRNQRGQVPRRASHRSGQRQWIRRRGAQSFRTPRHRAGKHAGSAARALRVESALRLCERRLAPRPHATQVVPTTADAVWKKLVVVRQNSSELGTPQTPEQERRAISGCDNRVLNRNNGLATARRKPEQ